VPADGDPILLFSPSAGRWAPGASLDLSPGDGGEVRARCDCGDPDGCPTTLQLLDSVSLPPWERALLGLDRSLAEVRRERRERAESLIWWRLERSERGLVIRPLLQEPRKRGVKKPRPISAEALLEEHRLAMSAIDRELAELVDAAARDFSFRMRSNESLLLRALHKLIGHPRVVLDGPDLQPIAVTEGHVELCVEADGERLALKIKLNGRTIPCAELAESLLSSAVDDALIEIDALTRAA
jgi:hypothetical protein